VVILLYLVNEGFTAKMTDKEEVVGIHSPEFQFEKNFTNVKDVVQRFGIKYPVILDSDRGTWNAVLFRCQVIFVNCK
jgi:hypothetical protein